MTKPTLRWKRRPPGSNWGDFGPDDEVGRINLLTPQKVLQGIAEVKEGRSFCLSLPLDYPGGKVLSASREPPLLAPTTSPEGRRSLNLVMRCEDPNVSDVWNDDRVTLSTHYSTHWDALAHCGQSFDADDDGEAEAVFYNGFTAEGDIAGEPYSGARRLDIAKMAARCIQGRAVMIDLAAHFGTEERSVGYADIAHVLEKDAITVEPGDMVCVHTGFAGLLMEMRGKPDRERLFRTPALDGSDQALLQWISKSGIVALIADNYAVEKMPANRALGVCCSSFPLHEHCLFRLGVHLGELWHLSELAAWLRANQRSRFLLTAPPLRLTGGVGSPATPIATV